MNRAHIYMATDVDQLLEKVHLKRTSLFQKHSFVTQTSGINHYIKLKIAEKNGVISNQEFLSPNELIMEVAHIMGNLNSAEFSTENVRWRLFKLLNSSAFCQEFPEVAVYFEQDELKRMQLATKLADLFDQYTVFRTDMMLEWQEAGVFGVQKDKVTTEGWQKWLWLALKAQIATDFLDKAEYQREIIRKLELKDVPYALIQRFSSVHVFGLTVLTNFHLELLWNLRHIMDVCFYFVNPCVNDFWYDCISEKDLVKRWSNHRFKNQIAEYSIGNELLTSWGKVSQELYSQLFLLDDEVFSCLDYVESEYYPKTLLGHLQRDIHENVRANSGEIRFEKELFLDNSIQIKSNYTEAREVEVLYDYLVNLIDNVYEGSLQPHDVVVMLPDVEKYLPFIKAVFDHSPKKIPYSIGDRAANKEQSLLTLCLQILQTYSLEFTSESIIQLLDFELINKKYSIQNIDLIRQLVRESNVRFGIKGDVNIETHLVSWELGLSKMFMSIFMKDTSFEFEGNKFYALSSVEGFSDIDQILNFIAFVRNLIAHAGMAKQTRSLRLWNDYFAKLMLIFVDEDGVDNEDFVQLTKKLEMLNRIDEKVEGVDLNFETYVYILKSYHSNETISDGYFRGRVTFCQALPMRSIPFKVVAFLGLNAKDFPRKDTEFAFDLIKVGRSGQDAKKRLGDRSTKENDKYLFLEAVLSAKENLYLSYLGINIKDNKQLNPSSLVEEMLDYLTEYAEKEVEVKQLLVQTHPLRADSNVYRKKPGYFTYLSNTDALDFMKCIGQKESKAKIERLDLIEVIRYFKNPIAYYYNKNLGVYYKEEALLLPEIEVFEIEKGLHTFAINTKLLNENVEDLTEFIQKQKALGELPLGNVSSVLLEGVVDKLKEAKASIDTFKSLKEKQSIEVDCQVDAINVFGSLEGVYDNVILRVNTSKKERQSKNLLAFYIEFLFANYSLPTYDMQIIHVDNEQRYISKDKIAHKQLKEMGQKVINFYLANSSKLIPFYPMISDKVYNCKFYSNDISKETTYDTYLKRSQDVGLWENEEEVKKYANEIFEGLNLWYGSFK